MLVSVCSVCMCACVCVCVCVEWCACVWSGVVCMYRVYDCTLCVGVWGVCVGGCGMYRVCMWFGAHVWCVCCAVAVCVSGVCEWCV